MNEKIYEFDPCSIDNESIDLWKPAPKDTSIQKSEWRQAKNKGHYHVEPGIDDIKKIKLHIKKGYPDLEIMDAFRINADTLIAIKNDRYDPIHGISLDNQSKIYNKFDSIDKKLLNIVMALNYIANNFLGNCDPACVVELKYLIKGATEKKPKIPRKINDEEE